MTLTRAIIVDDESHCRASLEAQLAELGNVEVMASCGTIEDARNALARFKADLLFLDVELSDSSGFELLKDIPLDEYDVIFTTAYQQYALQAVKASALDYLLKPVSLTELSDAIRKHIQKKSNSNTSRQVEILFEHYLKSNGIRNLALPMQEGIEFISIKDIIRLESNSNYTTFYIAPQRKITVPVTLKEYEDLLAPNGFVRIHRSHMINIDFLDKYYKGDGGYVKMKDGSTADVSRQRKDEFMKAIGKFS